MAKPNISLWGATYSGAAGVELPTSGGGTATFPWVEGSQTITDNGTTDVTNLASVTVAIPIVHYYTGSGAPSSSLGEDGDIYLQTS